MTDKLGLRDLRGRKVGSSFHKILQPAITYSKIKLVSAIFYQFFIFSQTDSPLKTMKNVFYFI